MYLGSQQQKEFLSHMMNLHQTFRCPKTILVLNSFHCIETICAPCGVVVAWTKFDKSESPTKILNFLESVYLAEESRPDYICIDKACVVLCTAITNGSWEQMWKKKTQFIVDSYHYINHCADDYLCCKL